MNGMKWVIFKRLTVGGKGGVSGWWWWMKDWEELEGGRVKSSSLCGAGRAEDGDRLGGGWMLSCRPPAAGGWIRWVPVRVPYPQRRINASVLLLRRFSLVPGLHPDWMLVLFFAHTHLTVTVTLCLLLVPKVTSSAVYGMCEEFFKFPCTKANIVWMILTHDKLFINYTFLS